MLVASLVALVHEECMLMQVKSGVVPFVVFKVGPELDVHVYMGFLPVVVSHDSNHVDSGLIKLFEAEILILDGIWFVMSQGRRDKGVGAVRRLDDGKGVVINGEGDGTLGFI